MHYSENTLHKINNNNQNDYEAKSSDELFTERCSYSLLLLIAQ